MATKTTVEEVAKTTTEKTQFAFEGLALLESMDTMPAEMKLTAYVFDRAGKLIGSSPLDDKGRFNVPVRLERPADVQIVIGPAGDPQEIRASSAFKQTFLAKDWIREGDRFLLKPRVFVPKSLVALWWPIPVTITGHVRTTTGKPIPFLKVEIFDVDREPFLWPFLVSKAATAANLKVVHIPDLVAQGPVPPVPGPGPEISSSMQVTAASMAEMAAAPPETAEVARFLEEVSLQPQPLPPVAERMAARAAGQVGEMATAEPAIAQNLANLTLTSKVPLWSLFPFHFYSRQLVDTVYTDPTGLFSSCFLWRLFHIRRGRLRLDSRPDIILRVTQTVDGVEKVLYMDPYTSTRWNVTNTHIDLWLDDPEILSGSGVIAEPAAGMQVFFTRVGNDEVYDIDQTTGLYHGGSYSNVAYGSLLHINGQLGKTLSTGTPKRYYRLSYRKGAAGRFTPITAPLTDTRVNASTMVAESHFLGPLAINGNLGLYEVRDLEHFYWFNPDLLGLWNTPALPEPNGLYTLRLEVFDENGQPLVGVDYRNGTVQPTQPPAELPKVNLCDLVLAVQNVRPVTKLEVVGVPMTGVISWSPGLTLNFKIDVTQPNGRLFNWGLQYTKGLQSTMISLPAGGSYPAGIPGASQTLAIPVSSLGITGSMALAFKLWAHAHIRDGYHFIYYNEEIQAVAIQRCPPVAFEASAMRNA